MKITVTLRGLEVEEAIKDYLKKKKFSGNLDTASAPSVVNDANGCLIENIRTVNFNIEMENDR